MSARYPPGAKVLVVGADPTTHTRAPRYVRGHVGQVVEDHGRYRLPDDVVAAVDPPAVENVYAVRFPAADLWGEGDHCVIVNLWESYLRPASEQPDGGGA